MINNVDMSGASGADELHIQLGDSGGVETSGYVTSVFNYSGDAHSTKAFIMDNPYNATSNTYKSATVIFVLESESSNTWTSLGSCDQTNYGAHCNMGRKALSGELDRVRITTDQGNKTFDSGEINISYE